MVDRLNLRVHHAVVSAMTAQEAQTSAESHERACPACIEGPCLVAVQLQAAANVGPMWRRLRIEGIDGWARRAVLGRGIHQVVVRA